MPSRFPGMDLYLEQDDAWHDFHERFIPLVAAILGGQLRPRYIVKIDEHVYVHELSAESRRWIGRADVSVGRGSPEVAHEPAPGALTELLEAPRECGSLRSIASGSALWKSATAGTGIL